MRWRLPWQDDEAARAAAAEAYAEHAEETARMVRSLRDARVTAGLSVVDVERDTRINRTYIEAIESGRFTDLPAPVYARGFVRSYARYLGLDPEAAVAAMPQDLPAPVGLEPMPGLRRTAAPVLPAVNVPVAGAIAVAVALVVAAILIVPRIAGESGVDLPAGTPEPTPPAGAGASPTPQSTPGGNGSQVPEFEPGTTPDFTGIARAEAQRVLQEFGVTPLIVEAADGSPAGLVFAQSPAPGTALREGDVVTLFVSQGP
jgi:cytoskeletal protein RodZ